MKKFLLLVTAFHFVNMATNRAAEWQWSCQIRGVISQETNDYPRAFLWIPPKCKQVRSVVVGQHNMLEEGILEHPFFRKKMADLGIAEIWITPGIDQVWSGDGNSQSAFYTMLDSLASISGYPELKFTSIIPLGHSAMATFPWNFAASNASRILAILSVHGDAPATNLTGYGRSNMDWTKATIDGIPGLMVEGEYEWWEDRVQPAVNYKNSHPAACISFLCDAGRGHFDYSDQLVQYLALFVEKAAKNRLPSKWSGTEGIRLKEISPQNGWLAARWHKGDLPRPQAASFSQYKGDRQNSFWYFDKEMARRTEQIYARQYKKRERKISFFQNGRPLDDQNKVVFIPDSDGLTFHLSARFTDNQHRQLMREPSTDKIRITRICGPVQMINDTTFAVQFSRFGLFNQKRTPDIWLMASNEGDKRSKSSVQQQNIRIPYRNREGAQQKISFEQIPNIRQTTAQVALHAESTSGLPVCFYVQEGPAEIIGRKLCVTKIPAKALFPLKVTVVAWQYGRSSAPKVQSAEPVARTFYITK